MTRHIFFRTVQNGRGTSLVTVPGQMLTSRTPLKPDMMTHGCEYVRRKHPVGTVFYSDPDQIRLRKGCYHVLTLHPLMLRDGTPVEGNIFTEELLNEYKSLYAKSTTHE